ncbi:MAG TPA: SCP2 sterol-binding domain-containing protein [Ilumatobacter sp.]|nr:SCP2 sterol-binding domain-containing protein [Ilumatobacter sp.]
MYQFLSQEWIDAVSEIRQRHAGDAPSTSVAAQINLVVTDVPFGDGVVSAYLDSSSGSMQVELGEFDEPDAVVMTDYEVARSIIVNADPAFLMQAFLGGRIKVQGDMAKLLMLQSSAPDSETADEIADEIRSITAD